MSNLSNDHWFERNCDPSDVEQQEQPVQSGGGGTGAPGGAPSPNTLTAVVEQLLGQCYGDQGTLQPNNFPDLTEEPLPPPTYISWKPILDTILGLGLDAPDTGDISISVIDNEDENSGDVCTSPKGTNNMTRDTVDCDDGKNPDLEECLQNHLDCHFRPYVGGAWKPPQADCDSFVPKASYGMTNQVCIRNCVTERVPIFEYLKGMSNTGGAVFNGPNTITVSGNTSQTISLEFQWDDNPRTYGTAVDQISVGGATFTRNGEKGKITTAVTLSPGDYSISYSGLSGSGYSVDNDKNYGDNKSVKFLDNDGNDANARFSILGNNNIGRDHRYGKFDIPTSGYQMGGIRWYGNLVPSGTGRSVPVYRTFSSSRQDTQLLSDPAGEGGDLDAGGYQPRDEVLFYGYREAEDMISELMDGEEPAALHRYYSFEGEDHRYSIEPLGNVARAPNLKNNIFRFDTPAESRLKITLNTRRGSASYENTIGWYVTDENNVPIAGRVLLSNATDSSGTFHRSIPKDEINSYMPCNLGFFMIPDGNNGGASDGQDITFSAHNNQYGAGYTTNQNSHPRQNGYVWFSDRRLNPGKKDMTKWPDAVWQYWEDLWDGDEDYNDTRLSYRVGYGDSEYYYEGIECYVFAEPAAPVFASINTQDDCEKKAFKEGSFADVMLTRTECGNYSEHPKTGADQWECGKCKGNYANSRNRVQRVTVAKSTTLSIRSHGGMTAGYGDCTKFTWQLKLNGFVIYEETSLASEWKTIGAVLHTFPVEAGDKLVFKIKSIDTGHYNGKTSPAFALRDENEGTYVNTWTVNLITQSHSYGTDSKDQAEGQPQSGPDITEPCGLPISGELFIYENDPSQVLAGRQMAVTKEDYTTVLTNKVVNQSANVFANNADRGADRMRYINGKDIASYDNGYIGYVDVVAKNDFAVRLKFEIDRPTSGTYFDWHDYKVRWYLDSVEDWGSGGFKVGDEFDFIIDNNEENYNKRTRTWFGPKYVKLGFKVTGINSDQCPDPAELQGRIQDIALDSYSDLTVPRQPAAMVINNQSTTGNEYAVNMNEIFQSFFLYENGNATSFHQYWMEQTTAGNNVVFRTDYYDKGGLSFRLKIRVTFQDHYDSGDAYKFDKYGWFGMVSISDVFDYGKRYDTEDVINIQWPPADLQYSDGSEAQSPYYPSQTNLPKKVLVRDATTGRYKRNARMALYQKMHDKTSNIWYSNRTPYQPTQIRNFNIIIKDTD